MTDYKKLTKGLMGCESRGKAFTMLGEMNFSKAQLLDYANYLNIRINEWQSKDLTRASIIAFTSNKAGL